MISLPWEKKKVRKNKLFACRADYLFFIQFSSTAVPIRLYFSEIIQKKSYCMNYLIIQIVLATYSTVERQKDVICADICIYTFVDSRRDLYGSTFSSPRTHIKTSVK